MRLKTVAVLFAGLFAPEVVLGAAAAAAEVSNSDHLTGAEVRDFMMGQRMSGVLVETNERWYECVAPSGDTVYNIEGQISTGFVEVEEDGRTCFTYPRPEGTSRSCFLVQREADKPVFVEEVSGIRFRVDRIDDAFDQCPTSAPIS